MLLLELFNSSVFLGLNLGNLRLTLSFHVFTQTRHLSLVLLLNLAGNTLMLLPFLSGEGIVVLRQSVTVFGLTDILLLFHYLESAQVLL